MARAATERINLPARLRGRRFDAAIATTYTFDAVFFEEYCLDRLSAFSDTSSITVFVDRGTYDAMIAGPEHNRPKQANLRYLVHPVSPGSTFHPKVWLFVSPEAGRLVIGSANLTRPGFMGNAELVGTFDVDIGKREQWRALFQQAFRFLVRLEQRWPGKTVASNLREIERQAPWLVSTGEAGLDGIVVDNLDTPIIETLQARINGSRVETLYVLSPYFDQAPDLLDVVLSAFRPARTMIFTQNGTTTMTSEWLKHPSVRRGKAEIFLCRYAHDERPQSLHGKLIALTTDDSTLMSFGSANFTSAALQRTASNGNVECVLTQIFGRTLDVGRICDPLGSGILLRNEKDLRSAASPWEAAPAPKAINLREVTLEGETVVADLGEEPRVELDRVEGRFVLPGNAEITVRLVRRGSLTYGAEAPPRLIQSAYRASTMVRVVSIKGERVLGESNSVLLTNLLDFRSGESIRRQRLIRDAYDGPVQFFQVLRDLMGQDEEALREFLALCDILVLEAPKPSARRAGSAVWDAEGMRTLQERNLRVFTSLRDVVLGFVNRHLRRLRRHVDYGTAAGIENFMHIALAIGGTLRAQFQRLALGLEAARRPLTPEEWGSYREQADAYLEKLRELILCTTREYVPRMLDKYGVSKVGLRIEPDLGAFEQVWQDVRESRNAIETLRHTLLRVVTERRVEVQPPYNEKVNLMSEKLWTGFADEIESQMQVLRFRLGQISVASNVGARSTSGGPGR